MLRFLSNRSTGGAWLIGVYKGRAITATRGEVSHIWRYNEKIRASMFFPSHDTRQNLVPYFFLLDPVKERVEVFDGDKKIIERFGLDSLAYKYRKVPPIAAYGRVDGERFVLDRSVMRRYKRKHGPLHTSHLVDSICVLALETKGYAVRTGTFFRSSLKGNKIIFEPCAHEGSSLVGKGVLSGIDSTSNITGSMTGTEAVKEMGCPVSKLCVRFWDNNLVTTNRLVEGGWRYIVYREVSTDLRADMPLGFLKISRIKGAFGHLFRGFGNSVKNEFGNRLSEIDARNVQLDGTIVDYAGLGDADISKNRDMLANANYELRLMIFAAAIVSIAGKEALVKMMAKNGFMELVSRNREALLEKYNLFFKCFSDGVGTGMVEGKKIIEYFEETRNIDPSAFCRNELFPEKTLLQRLMSK